MRCHCGTNNRYEMSFWHLIRAMQTQLHAKGFVLPMDGTIVYRTFSINYNELCTKCHLLSFFSIKVVFQRKVSCVQIVSIMYWKYILISLRMQRLHLSLLYVGYICIIKRPNSFVHFVFVHVFTKNLKWIFIPYTILWKSFCVFYPRTGGFINNLLVRNTSYGLKNHGRSYILSKKSNA